MRYALKLPQPDIKFKIMKTQNNKLDFTKSSVLELNDSQMYDVDSAGASFTFHMSKDKETQMVIEVTIYW